jgi:hypothetical protein
VISSDRYVVANDFDLSIGARNWDGFVEARR